MSVSHWYWRHFVSTTNPSSLSSRLRRRRARILLQLLDEIPSRPVRILDLGGRERYWHNILTEHPGAEIEVELVNNSEKDLLPTEDPRFRNVLGDATDMKDYADRSFDLVHSNSVVEHVGGWQQMKAFAREVKRLAPAYFVQTPNFWFPYEPHYCRVGIQWLPDAIRASWLTKRRIGYMRQCQDIDEAMTLIDHCRLVDRRQFGWLFDDAEITAEKILGLNKSWIAIRRG